LFLLCCVSERTGKNFTPLLQTFYHQSFKNNSIIFYQLPSRSAHFVIDSKLRERKEKPLS